MNKLTYILPVALFLSGCTLLPSASITGTEQQKAEKLSQILASGGKADCKVTNLTDQSSTQIIISGKKMKFVGSDMGEGKKGNMINDGQYTYIWTDGEKVGFKTKIEEVKPEETTKDQVKPVDDDTTKQVTGYDDETKFRTDCTTRNISDVDFTPPADVEFTDFAQMMKAIPSIPAMPAIPSRYDSE